LKYQYYIGLEGEERQVCTCTEGEQSGLRIKMKGGNGLTRREMSIYPECKPSPRTIFNVGMESPHEQRKETLRLLKACLSN